MSDFDGLVGAIRDWPARLFYTIAVASAILLLAANSRWAGSFGASDAPRWFRAALMALTVASASIAFMKSASTLTRWRDLRSKRKSFEHRLDMLTDRERAVFASFVEKGVRTATFVLMQGASDAAVTAADLARRGYLCEIGRQPNAFFIEISYGIDEKTFEYLTSQKNKLVRAKKGQAIK